MDDDSAPDLKALRAEYEKAVGKKPFTGWDADELRRRILHAPPTVVNTRDLPMPTVVITAPHVYLPLDEAGNGREDWAVTAEETTKVERRARLRVPGDLAKFLSERDQAEIL